MAPWYKPVDPRDASGVLFVDEGEAMRLLIFGFQIFRLKNKRPKMLIRYACMLSVSLAVFPQPREANPKSKIQNLTASNLYDRAIERA